MLAQLENNALSYELFLNQKPSVFWLTGLSGAGKTSIALDVEKKLYSQGYVTKRLDGDVVRHGINDDLGFSEPDRLENIRRIAEISRLFVESGIITICSFISPTIAIRKLAKNIVDPYSFFEIFVDSPLKTCEKRDVKGLYKKARNGEIKNFTGISAPYEVPLSPDLIIDTDQQSLEQSSDMLFSFIIKKSKLSKK